MNRFTVFQELRVPQQTNLAFVTHVKTGFYVGFPVKKRRRAKWDITLAVWIRVFVYYVNKLFTCEQERVSMWTCVRVHTSVCQGGQECLQQVAPASVLSNAYVRAVFNRNTMTFTHRTSKYFWTLLNPKFLATALIYLRSIMILLACNFCLCPFGTQTLCDHTSYGWSFRGFIDYCAEYIVWMFFLFFLSL